MQIVERSRGMMTYDEERKDITFLERELANTSENWRARILTTQDSLNRKKTGTIQPISLPDGLEDTENVRSWCEALRLCGHDMRRVYARKAIQAGCMPHALLQYTARNAYGHMMPIPCWVSSCAARRVGVLAPNFLARTWPFWTGSTEIIFFKDEKPENGIDLANFLQEQLAHTNFPPDLLSKWCEDLIHWRTHLTERHHSSIPLKTLLDSRKAFIVSFDVRSLKTRFQGYAQALETYTILTEAAMEKAISGSYPSAVFAQKLFLVILMNLDKFLESYEGEDGCALRSVMEAASMLTIECFAEEDAKRHGTDTRVKRIKTA